MRSRGGFVQMNPLCSVEAIRYEKTANDEEEEEKPINLFSFKGNSKFKNLASKFDDKNKPNLEEPKQEESKSADSSSFSSIFSFKRYENPSE